MMNYFSKKKKWTAYLILLAFVFTCIVPANLGVAYATEETADVTTFPINKTADGLDENDQTNVTLTVPGTLEGNIDIVLVLGGTMQANQETVAAAINLFKPLMESGKSTVKLGLVAVERGEDVVLDLADEESVLNPDTYEQLIKDKFNYISNLPYGSTNLHSELVEAKKMLDADTSVKAENKYMFVIATGRTYFFDDVNGNEATVLSASQNEGQYAYGNYVWQSQRAVGTSYYQIPKKYNNDFSAYWKDVKRWIENDGNKYVYTLPLDSNDNASFYNWAISNGSTCYLKGTSGQRVGVLINNPVPQAENFIYTNTVAGIPFQYSSKGGPDHALNYERAQYESWKVYTAMQEAGYNCYALCSEQYRYQNNSSYIGGNGIQLGHAFMDFLAGGKAVTLFEDNGTTQGKLKENFFAPVAEDILYTCSKNSTVVDYIGANENGNFEFIENAEYIKLNVGGVDYTTAQVDAKEGADSSYTFTAPGATNPTFWLDYYYGDGKTTERFVWTFGESVSMEKPALLTYKLQLTGKSEKSGGYVVPTNNSATLYPVDSDGNPGTPQEFPVPEVQYSNVGGFSVYKDVNLDDTAVVNNEFNFQLKVKAVTEQWDASLVSKRDGLQAEIDAAAEALDAAEDEVDAKVAVFETNAKALENAGHKLVMAEEGTTASAYNYTIATYDGDVVTETTTGSSYIWDGVGSSGAEKTAIEAVIDAIKELAETLEAWFDRAFMIDLSANTTGSALGFLKEDAKALLFAERDRLDAKEDYKAANDEMDKFMATEVTTPAAITIKLIPMEGSNKDKQLEEKEYALQPVKDFKSEDGKVWYDAEEKAYRIDFNLFGETGYAVSVEATTGTMVNYMVSETGGYQIDGYTYDGTDVTVAGVQVDSDQYRMNTGDQELDPSEKPVAISFMNKYSTTGNPPSYPPYTPTEDPKDPPKKDPEDPEEIIEDPEVPLGEIEVPGEPVIEEELEDPEVPLGDAPATGDSANAVPFMALLAAAIGGLAITRRKFN